MSKDITITQKVLTVCFSIPDCVTFDVLKVYIVVYIKNFAITWINTAYYISFIILFIWCLSFVRSDIPNIFEDIGYQSIFLVWFSIPTALATIMGFKEERKCVK